MLKLINSVFLGKQCYKCSLFIKYCLLRHYELKVKACKKNPVTLVKSAWQVVPTENLFQETKTLINHIPSIVLLQEYVLSFFQT